MEQLQDIINLLFSYDGPQSIAAYVAYVIMGISIIIKLSPSKKDDVYLSKGVKFLEDMFNKLEKLSVVKRKAEKDEINIQ